MSPNTASTPIISSNTTPTTSTKPTRKIHDVVIRLAGNSQDGIQAVGGFLARLAGRSEQEVMTYMTIPSTISGGPSIFQVRIGSGEVFSAGDQVDFLVAFYQHSYENHIHSLKPGGILLYDSDHVTPNLNDKTYHYVGVPITSLTVEAIGGTARDKGKNIFTLGLLAKVFDLDTAKLEKLILDRFKSKDESIARNALNAFNAGYAYPIANYLDQLYTFEKYEKAALRPQVTMDGNQAIAYGLITGGVRFGAGYPITPWSSIMEILRAELPKYGGIFVQAEDELGAVSMALGFSFAGYLAVTGSSGPGISLKMEALGWGCMAEMPLVVINVQRGGPSTGLPTNVEQSDLMQAIYGSHGDAPRVVLAPQTVEDCFYTAIEACRIAREYSVPVIVLSDTALATRIEAFEEPHLEELYVPVQLDLSPHEGNYKPYALDRITRHLTPGRYTADGKYPVVSGLEHDEYGHPTASPKLHSAMTAKRRDKLRQLAATLPTPAIYGDETAEILLVGWGSTYGPIREAVDTLRRQGHPVAAIHLRHLHPLPPRLAEIFTRFKQVLVIEMNDYGLYGYGQLATLLRATTVCPHIKSHCKTDGQSFRVSEIIQAVQALAK
ncbi:MAG: 2-oxoacid:acceptor oxidoreductase subunit alpha [Methylacidiphilales bacterium]|nr:2-oxoacid:acceptor oxidoreductase subunit alpha [Candidatus Methylacidiphilales bacterium]MDW8349529.1 2-oxoacid:acceptor oxidoreductase subunit alpha [Verrucomicrobiae bacterium]